MSSIRKKILFLTPEMPAETGGGLSMRCGLFLQAASELGDVDVIVNPISSSVDAHEVDFTRRYADRLVVVESDGRPDTLLQIITQQADPGQGSDAFAAYGKPSLCMHLSTPVLQDVERAVAGRHYDMTIVMRLRSLPVFRAAEKTASLGTVICDFDDDDEQLVLERAQHLHSNDDAVGARWYKTEAAIYRAYRAEIMSIASAVTVSGRQTMERLGKAKSASNLMFIPNSVTLQQTSPSDGDPVMLFVGNLRYWPNIEGLDWFVDEVLPLILAKAPAVQFHIVGRNPSAETVSNLVKAVNTDVFDSPTELELHYAKATIAVVPLKSGSGSRIKILEAGAYGVAVVSTQKGAEGLDLQNGTHGWVTPPDPEAFAKACLDALNDLRKRSACATALRERVSKEHNRDEVLKSLVQLMQNAAGQ